MRGACGKGEAAAQARQPPARSSLCEGRAKSARVSGARLAELCASAVASGAGGRVPNTAAFIFLTSDLIACVEGYLLQGFCMCNRRPPTTPPAVSCRALYFKKQAGP